MPILEIIVGAIICVAVAIGFVVLMLAPIFSADEENRRNDEICRYRRMNDKDKESP